MRNSVLVVAIVILVLLSGSGAIIQGTASGKFSAQSARADTLPIRINSNSDFANAASENGWSGNGTPQKPYIIENMNITGGTYGLYIGNTTAYFKIKSINASGLRYESNYAPGAALVLYNVSNGNISGINVSNSTYGIWIKDVKNTSVESVTLNNILYTGLQMERGVNITVHGGTISGVENVGINIADSTHVKVENFTIYDAGTGIAMKNVSESSVEQNDVSEINARYSSLPGGYHTSFENGAPGWSHTDASGTAWELGTPTSEPGSAHSGSSCWGTNLSGNYGNNANSLLISPPFVLNSNVLSFWQWYSMESGFDYGYVKISTDNGSTWSTLIKYNGNSDGWKYTKIDVSRYVGKTVRFGFLFTSDSSVTYAGWYIDDFALNMSLSTGTGLIDIEGTNNTITSNNVDTSMGIHVYGSENEQINNNYLTGENEVDVQNSTNIRVLNNTIQHRAVNLPIRGLVAYWNFNEGSGTTLHDVSGHGNDGTIYGAKWVKGISGDALLFDGNSYVKIPESASFDFGYNDLTVSVWVKVDKITGNVQQIIENGHDPEIQIGAQGDIQTFFHDGGCGHMEGPSISPQVWTNIILIKQNGIGKLYLNGKLVNTTNASSCSCNPIGDIYIGMDQLVGGEYFNGAIDEVRIYNRALSQDEIKELYLADSLHAGLVAHWNFNEGSGSVLHDVSGHGNDGTIHGASWGEGIDGSALYFNGNAYVDLGNRNDLILKNFTEYVWIKPEINDDAFHGFLGHETWSGTQYRSPSIWVHGKTCIHTGFGDGNHWDSLITSPGTIEEYHWNQVAVSFNGSSYNVYINGELVYSTTEYAGKTPYPTPISTIGKVDNYFVGSIDEIRIYNRALSAEEIKELYTRDYHGSGIQFTGVYNSVIAGNSIVNETNGIKIISSGSNELINNMVVNSSSYGIFLKDSNYNRIFNNTLYYNDGSGDRFNASFVQAYDNGINYWNTTGNPQGYGNYWYEWANNNNSNDQNGDGIVDWPYALDGGAIDHFPEKSRDVHLPALPPTAPLNLNGTPENRAILLSWSTPLGLGSAPITGYRIYRNNRAIATVSANQTTYRDSSLVPYTTYYYFVTAINSVGESERSNEIWVSPMEVKELVAYWNFNEGAGNKAHDVSGNNNNGTIYGATWTHGVNGSALNFNRANDNSVKIPESGSLKSMNDTFTVAAWVYLRSYPETGDHGEVLLMMQNPDNLANTNENGLIVYVSERSMNYNFTINTGEPSDIDSHYRLPLHTWVFIAITANENGTLKFYVNDTVVYQTTWNSPLNLKNMENTWIGTDIDSGTQTDFMDGYIDELMLFNYALSYENISAIYNEFTAPTAPNAPQNLEASITNGHVYLSWNAPASDGGSPVEKYNIYRTHAGNTELIASVGNETFSFEDSGVVRGFTYTYYVTAVNNVGESSPSEEVTVKVPRIKELVAYWNFNEGAGSKAHDVSGNNNNGTIYGATWTHGVNGSALNFNRAHKNYVEINASKSLKSINETFTIVSWVYLRSYPTSGDHGEALFMMQNPYTGAGGSENGLIYYVSEEGSNTQYAMALNVGGNNEIDTDYILPLHTWMFIAVSAYANGTLVFYVNDTAVYRTTWGSPLPLSDMEHAWIGTDIDEYSDITDCLDGYVDELMLFNYALSYENISAIYHGYTPPTVPGAPQSLNLTNMKDHLHLAWQPPTTDGGAPIESYRIYRGTSSSMQLVATVRGSVEEYDDYQVSAGTTYRYYVTAVNNVGEGEKSDTVSITYRTVPDAPSELKAVVGNGFVRLTWNAPEDGGAPIEEYRIYRNGTSYAIINGNQTWFNDTDVVNGVTYSYHVTAINSQGEGAPSNTIQAIPATVPDAPENLTAKAGAGYVLLTWSAPYDGGHPITEYRIYRNNEQCCAVDGNTTQFNDTGVLNGKTYSYFVVAANDIGVGKKSVVVQATPGAVPGAPAEPEVRSGMGYVNISWNAPANNAQSVISYTIYRDGIQLAKVNATITWYNDTDVKVGNIYTYYITAQSSAGESAKSKSVIGIPVNWTVKDNFTTDSGYWGYTGSAHLSENTHSAVLTDNGFNEAGIMWFNRNITARNFIVEFSYRSAGPDGFVMMFYKDKNYTPAYGGGLGFTNKYSPKAVPGYGVEFDAYRNTYDPSPEHVAIIYGNTSNHLCYINDQRVSGAPWHDVIVHVENGSIAVYLDGALELSWNGNINRTFGGFGFAGATGGINGEHRISSFRLWSTLPPSKPRNLTVSVENEVALKWLAPRDSGSSPITGYRIYRNGMLIATVSGNTTEYFDHNTTKGHDYTYYVTAINAVGESPHSNAVKMHVSGKGSNRNIIQISGSAFPLVWLIMIAAMAGALLIAILVIKRRKPRYVKSKSTVPPPEKQKEPVEQKNPDMIEVSCPRCGYSGTVPAEMKGQTVECPECGEIFKI